MSSGESLQRVEERFALYLERIESEGQVDLAAFLAAGEPLEPAERAEFERLLVLHRAYEPLLADFFEPGSERADLQRALGQGAPGSAARHVLGPLLGKGGMGEVFSAEDPRLERRLALKKVRLEPGMDPARELRRLARFVEEARIAGRLEHPGIVPVHELGTDADGQPYFTMRLVEGRTLAELFEQHHRDPSSDWSLPRLVGTVLRVAETLAFAHHAGVIHRDLKPANVMVGSFGETYVVDWGLARRLDAGLGRRQRVWGPESGDSADGPALDTQLGDVVGTPAYMAPEQAQGELAEIGPGVDVYAVGALLYELLAGRPPYPGRAGEALLALRLGPPPSLEQLAQKAPRELIAIAERAMRRELGERYSSMEALRDDLRAYLEGHVVRAYESGGFAELKKWIHRNRRLSAALLGVLLLTLVAALALAMRRVERIVGERFQDLERLADLTREAEGLWPASPARIEDLEGWRQAAQALLDRRSALLAAGLLSPGTEAAHPGDSPAAWRAQKLQELAQGVQRFADPSRGPLASVERRLKVARAIEARFGAQRAAQRFAALAPGQSAPPALLAGVLWPLGARAYANQVQSLACLHLPSTALELLELGPEALERAVEAPDDARLGVLLLPLLAPGGAACLLARTELSLAQWERLGGPAAVGFDPRLPARPLSWNLAQRALEAGGLRFPSQAECLHAAQADRSTRFWWGDDASLWPRFEIIAQSAPQPVASRPANPLGFHDLLGNLEEWCSEPSPNPQGGLDPSRRSVFGPAFYLPLEAAVPIWEARSEPFYYAVTDPRAETGVRPAADR